MSAANLDAADLAAVAYGGLIHEEVMDRIFQIDEIPLPLTERIGKGTTENTRFGWTFETLADPVIDGQVVDGSDAVGNDTRTGLRVQNFTETDVKVVRVSTRANASDTIGYSEELAHQVMQRQKELRRDVEAICLSNNPSVADNGVAIPGQTAGLDAWLTTNTDNGLLGTDGGFNTTTGLVEPYTPGTARALSETIFKDILQSVYEEGGDSMIVMARTPVVRLFSEFQFSAGARVATLTRETRGDGGPTSVEAAVNVYIGDFSTVTIVPNRLQQPIAAGVSTMFILDPSLLEQVFLSGYRVDPLAKTGLADNRLMLVDWGLRVGNEAGLGAIRDIDETAAMVA